MQQGRQLPGVGLADGPARAGAGSPRERCPEVAVSVRTDLDLCTVGEVQLRVGRALDRRPDRLVLDLSACPFADCRAVDLLLRTKAEAHRRGAVLVLRDPSPCVARLLELTGTAWVFLVESRRRTDSGLRGR